MGKIFQKFINNTLFLFPFLIVSSCTLMHPEMEEYLDIAGENKAEIKKVLDYYQHDSLKYAAACFLIKNMQGHYWKQSEASCVYYEYVNSQSGRINTDTLNNQWHKIHKEHSIKERYYEDIKTISSNYLIDHINASFNAWQKSSWKDSVNFQVFCHYVLPYRIYNEQINKCWHHDMRKLLYEAVKDVSDMNIAFAKIYNIITDSMRGSSTHCPYIFDPLTIYKAKGVSCEKRAVVICAALRAFGIPAVFDYSKGFANFSNIGMHAWPTGITNKNKPITVFGRDSIARMNNLIDGVNFKDLGESSINSPITNNSRKKITKIYRYEYKNNEKMSHVVDVSSLYGLDGKLVFNVGNNVDFVNLLTYQCGYGWKKEITEKPHNGQCVFNNLGKEIVYLAQVETKNNSYFLDYPIILFKDNVRKRHLTPELRTHTVYLYRKYPWLTLWQNRWNTMKGSIFEVSNNRDFLYKKKISTIHELTRVKNVVTFKNLGRYRYVRFRPSSLKRDDKDSLIFYNGLEEIKKGSMAEIQIYFKDKQLLGRPIYENVNEKSANQVFDGDITTFCTHDTTKYWIGLDLGHPQHISKIIYYPRHDDNFIRKGDIYELFYWNFSKWESLGRQIGKENDSPLRYDNVPQNALLLLKDLSRGQEEAVFTYDNGKQIFW